MTSRPYIKPPLQIEQQISLLRKRGLIVDADDKLEYYLQNVGYYHLSIYFKFFQRDDLFIEGTRFDDILRVYTFDNKLRLLLLELLERIEKSFKSRTACFLSNASNDSHCHTRKEMFIDEPRFNEIQDIFSRVYAESREVSVDHYKAKYTEPVLPPLWTMVEILSFGQVIKYVRALSRHNQNLISRPLGGEAVYILNWMHCLSVLRNICAHHSRLWNRDYTHTLKTGHWEYKEFFTDNKRLFNYLVALQILLNEINPTSSWQDKLSNLIREHSIEVENMGFPVDWQERLIAVKSMYRKS